MEDCINRSIPYRYNKAKINLFGTFWDKKKGRGMDGINYTS